jgi:hypothetical protein
MANMELPSQILVNRLRRLAKAMDAIAAGRGPTTAPTWRARANVARVAAQRVEDLETWRAQKSAEPAAKISTQSPDTMNGGSQTSGRGSGF